MICKRTTFIGYTLFLTENKWNYLNLNNQLSIFISE